MKRLFKKHWPLLGIGILLLVAALYMMGAREVIMKQALLPDIVGEEGLKLKNISYA